jgi:hypothetical protein
MMKKKGEIKAEVSYGREGIGLNSAYAVSDHVGVMLNGFSVFDNSAQYDRKYNYQVEAGLGYFTDFGDSFRYETYAGFSQGWLNSSYERIKQETDGRLLSVFFPMLAYADFLTILTTLNNTFEVNGAGTYYSAFMQHSVGVVSGANCFSFTGRVQYVKFGSYREEFRSGGTSYWLTVDAPPKIFIQPVLTDKIRIVHGVNLSLQAGINLEPWPTDEVFEWNKVFFYAGVEFTLDPKKWKKKK